MNMPLVKPEPMQVEGLPNEEFQRQLRVEGYMLNQSVCDPDSTPVCPRCGITIPPGKDTCAGCGAIFDVVDFKLGYKDQA